MKKYEERTKQFFEGVDKLCDELIARTMTIFEALGIVTVGDWSPPKGSEKDKAIRRMVKDVVRDIQGKIKEEYPSLKELE